MKRTWKTRLFSAVLAVSLLVGNVQPAFAVTADDQCDHHAEHTADCYGEEGILNCGFLCEECAGESTAEEPAAVAEPAADELPEEAEETGAAETEEAPAETEETSAETEEAPVEPAESVMEETFAVFSAGASSDTDLPDPDELFAMYAEQKLYGYDMATFGTQARARLNLAEQNIYDILKAHIETVASYGGSTEIEVTDLAHMTTSWTDTTYDEVCAAIYAQIDLDKIFHALLDDCPFDLYWCDKVNKEAVSMWFPISYYDGANGRWSSATVPSLKFSFWVAKSYQGGSATVVTNNVAKINAVKATAMSVVNNNRGKTDYEKLVAYRDYICEAVSYNEAAAREDYTGGYGDPWQLIYVFDNDSTTNVVCEGYSKAFQYLCDLSELDCISAEGVMVDELGQGPHMWNVVTLDGKNYLADVTNSDTRTIGSDGSLFLVGAAYKSGGYTFTCQGERVYFFCDDLHLNTTKYVPAVPQDPADCSHAKFKNGVCSACGIPGGYCGQNLIWTFGEVSGQLTVSGKGAMDDYFEDPSVIPWKNFYNEITKIVIEDGVTSIGTYAFYECVKLKNISIPDSVTTVPVSIYTKNLQKLVIPAGVTDLQLAFEENFVKFIEVAPKNKVYSSDQHGVLYNKDKTVLWCYPGGSSAVSYTVPEDVREIGDWAFRGCKNIETVTLPKSLEKLGDLAFCNSGLKQIHFQGEAPAFGSDVFAYLKADACYPKYDATWTKTVRQNYGGTINWIAVGKTDVKAELRQIVEDREDMTPAQIREAVQSLEFEELLTAMRNDEKVVDDLALLGGYSEVTITREVPIWNSTFHSVVGLTLNDIQTNAPVRLDKPVAAVGIPAGYDSDTAIHFSVNLDALGDDRTLSVPLYMELIAPNEIHPNFLHVFWRNPATNAEEEIPVDVCWSKVGWCVRFVICAEGDYVMIMPENAAMSGKCGKNLTWRYDDTYTLMISGSGEMYNYNAEDNRAPWYSVRENVKHIEIGEKVTGIGDCAFYDCRFADQTDIPASVKRIGAYAFYGMDERVFCFDGDAPEIADTAFYYAGDSTIYYDADKQGWTDIISKAFVEADGLKWVAMGTASDSCGKKLTWEFDAETGTLTISGTGEMFNTWWPYGSLDERAPWYGYAADIKSVVVNPGVTSIGHFAFFGCVNLTSVSIPDSVTSVGCAFVGCDSLKQLYIPASVTKFSYPSNEGVCTGLEKIIVDAGNKTYSSDAAGVLYNKDKTKLIGCPTGYKGDYVIPAGVKEIGDWAFHACSGLTGIVIPDSVTTLGIAAFNGCEKLSSVVIPNKVTNLGFCTFNGCAALTGIVIPENVTAIGSCVFSGCTSLETVWFRGNAPAMEYDSFMHANITAFYPAGNKTWKPDVMKDYAGKILWKSYCPDEKHTKVSLKAVAATCTESGLTEGSYCKACGEVFAEQQPVPALGHNYVTAAGETNCDRCDAKWYVRLSEEQISLDLLALSAAKLQAEVWPAEVSETLHWYVEEGSKSVISVDEDGKITAIGAGTGYVIAEAADGEYTFAARCRVEVTETPKVEDIQLSTTKLNADLYSREYAQLKLLPQLPQQYYSDALQDLDCGIVLESARFTDEAVAELFDLQILDDRHVLVVPTETAIARAQEDPKSIKSSYSSTITVKLAGVEDTVTGTEVLTLSVKQSVPKLTAKVAAFNSFYTGQRNEITVTGGTVTAIALDDTKTNPDWLKLEGNDLVLTDAAPTKSASVKVYLSVTAEEWVIPLQATLSVTNKYAQPGLKLSASTVTLAQDPKNSLGAELSLQSASKGVLLTDLHVSNIYAPAGYEISDWDAATGSFLLTAKEGFEAGKISLGVSFSNTARVVSLPLTVKTAPVTLKANKTSITLNRAVNDSAVITVTAAPADYKLDLEDKDVRLTDSKGNALEELDVKAEGSQVTVAVNNSTPAKGSYKLYISAGGSKEISVSVKVDSKVPTVTYKAAGSLDLSFPDNAVTVTPTFKNYAGTGFKEYEYSIAELSGKTVVDPDAKDYFDLKQDGGVLVLTGKDFANIHAGKTYALKLKLHLSEDMSVENEVKFTVKRTDIKLKLGKTAVTLNKLVADETDVAVSCTTAGYTFEAPVMELWENKGTEPLETGSALVNNDKLLVTWENGKIHVALGKNAVYGEIFQVRLKANGVSTAVTLKVTVLAESKSGVSVSLKAAGTVDVIRQDSAITVTPTYKNCLSGKNWSEQLLVYTSADNYKEPAEGLFQIEKGVNGSYILRNAGKLDPKVKYKVQLVSVYSGVTVRSPQTSVSVKMGSAKVTMTGNGATLFARDKNDRAELTFVPQDSTLNQVKKVTVKDAKYQNAFEIYAYGNGEFAIGFKNGKVDKSLAGKTVTLNLNIYLEGNETETANTTAKLKLTVLK